jgi:hypothetical protein
MVAAGLPPVGGSRRPLDARLRTTERRHKACGYPLRSVIRRQSTVHIGGELDLALNRDYWLDLISTALLALATIASAWSGYQAARWGGVQALLLTESNLSRTAAIGESNRANQLTAIDVALFVEYVSAVTSDNRGLSRFLEDRLRPEMEGAFKAWLATDPFHNPKAPSSPFVMPEYSLSAREEAQRLNASADRNLDLATKANQQSDDYVLLTVLFSSVLFFAGICTKPTRWSMRLTLLICGLVFFAYAVSRLAIYPIH